MGQMLRRLLEMHGLDAVAIARAAGVDLATIPAAGERIEIDKVDALLRVALPRIEDDAFGLQAARCWHPANLGVLGHAWLSSSTLGTGLARLARYWALVGERGRIELVPVPGGLKVRIWGNRGNPARVPVAAALVDIGMSVLMDMCRMNAGASLRPVNVTLRRRQAASSDAHARFYGCPVQFEAEDNAIILETADLERVLPTSNKQLAAMFDQLLAGELARLDRTDVVARCRAAILDRLPSGELTGEEVAKLLHVSPRSLQRKLAESGTTYQQLLDELRESLARQYVEDPQRSVTDITFLLGFAEPSSFTRAFRRWTGTNPSDYRSGLRPSSS
jgi:AraC-like DNA-binding protein